MMRNYQSNEVDVNPSTTRQNKDIKESFQKIKRPYMNRIQMSKLKLKGQLQTQTKRISIQATQLAEFIKELENKQNKKPSRFNKSTKNENEIIIDQQIRQDIKQDIRQDIKQDNQDKQVKGQKQAKEQKSLESCFTQWKRRGKHNKFQNSTHMINAYNGIFTHNIGSSCLKKNQLTDDFSYRKVQRQMLAKIFAQLKNNDQQTVNFDKIIKFLQECQLFLTIYGIDKKEIYNTICCAAHQYSNKLTQQEFIQFFLNNSTVNEQGQIQSNIVQSCCLSQQHWNTLKQIFDQLDTFGNGFIRVKQFFHKMKTVSVCKQLLQANCIQFPTIKKFYTFKKLIFILENKKTIQKTLSWQALKNLIQNFEYIDYPSIDEIFGQKIQNANITKDLNAFLLEDDILSKLKSIFERCPKFCKYFVNKKYFCHQLLHSDSIQQVLNLSVRKNNHQHVISLQANIKIIQSYGPEYFDMDQMLQLFSIKGIQYQKQKLNVNDNFQLSSTASDQEFQKNKLYQIKIKRVKSADKINKCLKNSYQIGKQNRQKNKIRQSTRFQQFELTKKRAEPSIRQKKLLQMLQQKKAKQESQIKAYISANPIPSSITNQNYLKKVAYYKKKLLQQKQLHITQTSLSKQRLTYLQTNTKLFQGCNSSSQVKEFQLHKRQIFQSKPISWFVKETNLLKTIQAEKQERRRNILQSTRDKYDNYWKGQISDAGEAAEFIPRRRQKKSTISYNVQNNSQYQRYQSNQTQQIQLQSAKTIQQSQQFKIKPTIVPDFKRLQQQFAQQLCQKKQMKSPTKIQQFNLSVNKQKANIQPLNLSIRNKPKVKQIQVQDNKLIIGTTRKFEQMVQLNHRKIAQREQQMEKIRRQQRQRKTKQKIFAKYMKSALKYQEKQKIKAIKKQKQNKITRKSQQQHQNEMKKIYSRVLSRPFLFQSSKATKQKKKKKISGKSLGKKVVIPKQQREHDYLNQVQQQQWQQQYEQNQQQQVQQVQQVQQDQQGQQDSQNESQQNNQSQQYNEKVNNQKRNLHNQSF